MLNLFSKPKKSQKNPTENEDVNALFDIDSDLFPGCIFENWQMNPSERAGLAGILHQRKPRICIEIGTFCAGSLSLIAQHADEVYSIDIDASIPERYAHLSNVTFITGDSKLILPSLFRQLHEQNKGVDFILVDGDHSEEGVKRDLNLILDYKPPRPLYLMMHDSFNPGCRQGMREAAWHDSDYLQYVDLDFIPGRVIEHGGGGHGELWGGLALAVFSAEKNVNAVVIGESAKMMFEFSLEFDRN